MDAARDRIVEIAVITLDEALEPVEEFVARVNPGAPIPEAASRVHGITDQDVADCPRFAEIADEVWQLIRGRIIIAHNAPFDIGILSMEFERAGIEPLPLDAPAIDTLQIEREVNPRTLEACFARYAGRKHEGAHVARDDARATIDVLKGQMRQHREVLPAGIPSLVRERLAFHFGREPVLFMDPRGRFYRDVAGDVRFNFGRHRGELVSRYPGFVSWMAHQDFTPRELAIAASALAQREPGTSGNTDYQSANKTQRRILVVAPSGRSKFSSRASNALGTNGPHGVARPTSEEAHQEFLQAHAGHRGFASAWNVGAKVLVDLCTECQVSQECHYVHQ